LTVCTGLVPRRTEPHCSRCYDTLSVGARSRFGLVLVCDDPTHELCAGGERTALATPEGALRLPGPRRSAPRVGRRAGSARICAVRTWRDREVINRLLTTPATWAVIGLSANTERTAYSIGQYLRDRLGMSIIPVNLRGEDALGERGYRRLAEVPGPVQVVDCFVNSQRVGAVVDQAIAEKDRLGIEAVWLQLGVIDEAAAERARAVGLDVVMNTCPAMEAPPVT
jgi:uncharacterized protein